MGESRHRCAPRTVISRNARRTALLFRGRPRCPEGSGKTPPPIPKEKAATRSPGHARLTTCRPRLSSFHRSPLPPATRARAQRPGKARARTLCHDSTPPQPSVARARQAPRPDGPRVLCSPGAACGRILPTQLPRTAHRRQRTAAETAGRSAGLAEHASAPAERERRPPAGGGGRRGAEGQGGDAAGGPGRPASRSDARRRCRDKRRRRRRRRRAAAGEREKSEGAPSSGEGHPFPPARVRRGEGEPSPPARRGGSREEALQLHGRTRGYGRGSARPDSRALAPTAGRGGEARVRPHPGPRTFLHARGSDRRRTDAGRGGEGGARLPAPPRPCRHGGGQRGTGIPRAPPPTPGAGKDGGGGVSPRGDSPPFPGTANAARARLGGRGEKGERARGHDRRGAAGRPARALARDTAPR
ncbi:translation initiation factor IF-2-like [Falco peregrinus]|uniref:translation initiation factor IF-2-like n=1 Tax=Falco peregrinus TaxID=8954 RepID=UPI002479C4F4|nr:translation initiation factor IF-2-like [Falco peregrinus]XP_055649443.1 translation initiation factor IF-2-like [Falco peregrinus]XP_055649444.1 translation initiation factor IF-2-like [Falco peregrinus]